MKIAYWFVIFLLFSNCYQGMKHNYSSSLSENEPASFKKSPQIIWQNKLKADPSQIFPLKNSLCLIADSRGGLAILDLTTGHKKDKYWKKFKRPVQLYGVFNNILYFSAVNNLEIVAWDLKNSQNKWTKKFKYDYNEMICLDSTLFLKSDTVLTTLHIDKGDTILSTKMKNRFAQGMTIFENDLFACTQNGVLKMFNQNLDSLSEYNLHITPVQKIIPQSDLLVAYNTKGNLRIFSLSQKKMIFSEDLNVMYASPLLTGDKIIIPFANGKIDAYDIKSRKKVWTFFLKNLLNLGLMRYRHTIIACYATGTVVGLDMNSGEKIWQFDSQKIITFAAPTPQGVLLAKRRELTFFGVQNDKE